MKFKAIFIDKERKITSIFLDIFLVIFFSFLLSNNLDLSIKIFYAFFNSILWFFISYTVGRYYTYITQRNIASLNRFTLLIIKHIGRTMVSLLLFLVVSKFFIISFLRLESLNTFIYITPLAFSIFSIFFQILIYKLFAAKISRKTNWLFIGNKENYDQLIKDLYFYRDLDLSIIYDVNLKNYNVKTNLYGLIIDNNELEDIYLETLKEKNLFEEIIFLKKWYEIYLQKIPSHLILAKDIINGDFDVNKENLMFHLKRMFDIIFSIFLLTLTFPLLVLVSLFIFLEDRASIFYCQNRTGLNGKIFRLIKLRSMKPNVEKGVAKWSTRNDPRVTKIGKLIRRTRIDELPQLLSVIKGDMSLIGPRPERPEFNMSLSKDIKNYDLRHTIRPGLSGWAQVNYSYGASIDDSKQKLSYDLFYLKNYSLLIDILIFLRTIKLVVNFRGSEPIS